MTLRRQLLLVGLLLLCLPWVGCQYIREMEGALRHDQQQSLQATAMAVAADLGEREELLYPNPLRRVAPADQGRPVYAHPVDQVLILDGYDDGWEDIHGVRLSSAPGAAAQSLDYQAATRGDLLYLMLRVDDDEVVFHNPGLSAEPNGDRLVLRTWQGAGRQEYVIATSAPGSVRAQAQGALQPGFDATRIHGFWQDAAAGYTLELVVPLGYTGGHLGFYLVNIGRRPGGGFETLGNINPLDATAPPWLIYSPTPLQTTLAPWSRQGIQLQVVDKDNWLIADVAASSAAHKDSAETFWLLRLLYRGILARGRLEPPPADTGSGRAAGTEFASALAGVSTSLRYQDPLHPRRTLLSAAVPIIYDDVVIGAVVARQSGEEYLSLTDQAFSRLLRYSLLALCAGAVGLLGYAGLLCWRISSERRGA